jgi:hypothetical protein
LPLGATLAAATEGFPEAVVAATVAVVTAVLPELHMEAAFLEVASRVEADMVVEGIKRHTRNSLESKVQSPKSKVGRPTMGLRDYGTTDNRTMSGEAERERRGKGEALKR